MRKHIPNILTLIRVLIIPLIIYSFYARSIIPNIISTFLFFIASVTDFFDGFLARKMQLQSSFGRCLDPIADKLLVIVTLVMVINFSNENKWILISALVIICREIIISGLREFLATINVDLPVSRIGKWKTAIQMLSIGALLLSGKGYYYAYNEVMTFFEADDFITVSLENVIQLIGEFGIFVSAILTIISAFFYVKYSLKFLFTNE